MTKREAEVIIVGSGAAGMMAGLVLANAGVKCIMLEKGGNIGACNACKAGGAAMAETDIQKEEGAFLSNEKLFAHMYGFSRGTVHAGLLRNVINEGKTVYDLYKKNGIGMTLRPDTYGVGFRARVAYDCSGQSRWQKLADDFLAHDGEIIFNQAGESLIQNETGRVIGVIAADADGEKTAYYGANVIVATGGYLGNPQMQRKHFGDITVVPLGNTLSDGAGINMAIDAGGMEDRNWAICANEFRSANHKVTGAPGIFYYGICGGLLVNRFGDRFMNEQYLSDEPLSIGGEISLREGTFYAVLDQEMQDALGKMTPYEFYGEPEEWNVGRLTLNNPSKCPKPEELDKGIAAGVVAVADTAKEAGAFFGMTRLGETVEAYNKMCEAGEDAVFGKKSYLLKALKTPPYYVYEYEPSAWCTFGGVKTDAYCHLLDREQNIIPGVYVTGVDNGSCYTAPYYDNEGATLGIALGTGVVAAKAILKER